MFTTKQTSMGRWCGIGSLVLAAIVSPLCAGTANATTTVTYYYSDMQGTPLVLADASGNVIATADFKPYGTQVSGVQAKGPGFAGQVFDPDSVLIYMQARYYDADAGRFLSVDPVTPANGGVLRTNRFSYANNNPQTNVDPDGRNTLSDGKNADPCASVGNVCAFDSEDVDRGLAAGRTSGTGEGGYRIFTSVPDDAYIYTDMDQQEFYAPKDYDFSSVYVAGKKDAGGFLGLGHASIEAVRKAVGQAGTFDLQRSHGVFYSAYTPASNFNVGVYMNGAGYSIPSMLALGVGYSLRHSSNPVAPDQLRYWLKGWITAEEGKYPTGRPVSSLPTNAAH